MALGAMFPYRPKPCCAVYKKTTTPPVVHVIIHTLFSDYKITSTCISFCLLFVSYLGIRLDVVPSSIRYRLDAYSFYTWLAATTPKQTTEPHSYISIQDASHVQHRCLGPPRGPGQRKPYASQQSRQQDCSRPRMDRCAV